MPSHRFNEAQLAAALGEGTGSAVLVSGPTDAAVRAATPPIATAAMESVAGCDPIRSPSHAARATRRPPLPWEEITGLLTWLRTTYDDAPEAGTAMQTEPIVTLAAWIPPVRETLERARPGLESALHTGPVATGPWQRALIEQVTAAVSSGIDAVRARYGRPVVLLLDRVDLWDRVSLDVLDGLAALAGTGGYQIVATAVDTAGEALAPGFERLAWPGEDPAVLRAAAVREFRGLASEARYLMTAAAVAGHRWTSNTLTALTRIQNADLVRALGTLPTEHVLEMSDLGEYFLPGSRLIQGAFTSEIARAAILEVAAPSDREVMFARRASLVPATSEGGRSPVGAIEHAALAALAGPVAATEVAQTVIEAAQTLTAAAATAWRALAPSDCDRFAAAALIALDRLKAAATADSSELRARAQHLRVLAAAATAAPR